MRKARRVVAVLVIGVVALAPAGPAGAGIPPGRYAIGDSVMVGAREELTGAGSR